MNRLKRILIALFLCVLVPFSFSSCSNSETIPKKDMANILVDMYLADFYIERHNMHSSTDSLLVYDGILEKYGYTYKQYQASVRKYIIKDDEYMRIHKLALDIIRKRKSLAISLASEVNVSFSESYCLCDSIKKYSSRELLDRIQYRSFRWLARIKPNDTITPGLGILADTSLVDFPADKIWWERNLKTE